MSLQGVAGQGRAWQGVAGQGKVKLKGGTMSLEKIKVEIAGKSPLLMHRFPLEPIEAFEKKTATDQAEICAYRDPDSKELYLPAAALQRGLVAGATYSKGKGRSTLQKSLAACLLVSPERVSLGVKTYTIDSRAVVMPATGGRVVRHRPRLDSWVATFEVEFDSDLITPAQMRRIVDDTGSRVGLLDFRPERKGAFGRFMVTSWK
jgi:hypothetical protein